MARAKRTRAAQPIIDPSLPIKAVTRNSVWGLQEDDAIRMWKAATKDAEVKKNVDRYLDIFKSAFLIEEVKEDIKLVKMKAGGVTVIPTYVFWSLHEEVEGQFRWDGQRNLRRFID